MKVKIEIVEGLEEEEAVIRCRELNDFCISLQNYLSKQNNGKRCLLLTDGGTDFFIPMGDIYFFETEGRELRAHTADYEDFQIHHCQSGLHIFHHQKFDGFQHGGI